MSTNLSKLFWTERSRIPRSTTAGLVLSTARHVPTRVSRGSLERADRTAKHAISSGAVRLSGRRRFGAAKSLRSLLGGRHAPP